MAEPIVLHLRPLPSDEALRRLLRALEEVHKSQPANFEISTNFRGGHFTGSQVSLANAENAEPVKKVLSELHARPYIIAKSITVGGLPHNLSVSYEAGDSISAVVKLRPNDQTPVTFAVGVADALARHFTFLPRPSLAMESVPEAARESLKTYEVALNDLNAHTARLAQVCDASGPFRMEVLQS